MLLTALLGGATSLKPVFGVLNAQGLLTELRRRLQQVTLPIGSVTKITALVIYVLTALGSESVRACTRSKVHLLTAVNQANILQWANGRCYYGHFQKLIVK